MCNDFLSPKYSPVQFNNVRITDSFWAPRLKVNREVTLDIEYSQLMSTGRLDSLRLEWKPGMPHKPHIFWESDIAKWIEAASYSLALHPDDELLAKVTAVVSLLEGAQQPDGYLNAHFTIVEPNRRWSNLRDEHELYCAGHLIEAAVSHKLATGSDALLNIVERYTSYINRTFGIGSDQLRGYPGHEEIELALIKLAEVTGDQSYLDLARYFINERGTQPHYFDIEAVKRGEDPAEFKSDRYEYNQAEMPVRELTKVAGHSVRAMYLYSAMADLARIDHDSSLKAACETLWHHLVDRNMYVTGGIGSSRHNEGFTTDYDLPNQTAYAETCAAIGLVFWAHRMLHLDNDAAYADVMERALYNGVISGVSLDGSKFLYENPLATDGSFHRQDWFDCACCPPNIARLLASLGGYIYSQSDSGIAVHLYIQGTAQAVVGGQTVEIEQKTDYPWNGAVQLTVRPEQRAEFELRLRIPGWCRDWSREYSVSVNSERADANLESGYLVIRRIWHKGDAVDITFPMPVEFIAANPKVTENAGSVALQRGPIVYCLESVDNPVEFSEITVSTLDGAVTAFEPELLRGVVTINVYAPLVANTWGTTLYRPYGEGAYDIVKLTFVPYCTWDNRASGKMAVWLPTTKVR
jgi:DUF1680 family protein